MRRALVLVLAACLLPPAADARVVVVERRCPAAPYALGCADLDRDRIYVQPGLPGPLDHLVRAHERAHFFDHYRLDDEERAHLTRSLGWSRWMPERWADGFARCRFPGRKYRGWGFGRVRGRICGSIWWTHDLTVVG